MPDFIKTQGVVLRNIPYGDKHLISHIFTESQGRLSFFVYGGQSRKKRNLFLPLNIVELVFKIDRMRELQKIKEIYHAADVSYHFNAQKTPVVFMVSELLDNIIKPYEPDTKLFDFIMKSLIYFDGLDKTGHFFSQFLVFLSYHLGIMAAPEEWQNDLYYDFEQNIFLPYAPVSTFSLNKKQTGYVIDLMEGYAYNSEIQLVPEERHDLIDKFLKYFEYRLGIKSLKSYDLFRRVL